MDTTATNVFDVPLVYKDAARWTATQAALERVKETRDLDALVTEVSAAVQQPQVKCTFFSAHLPESSDAVRPLREAVIAALPALADLALSLPELFPQQLPLLVHDGEDGASVTLTRRHVACLLFHSLLGSLRGVRHCASKDWSLYCLRDLLCPPGFSVRTCLRVASYKYSPSSAFCVLNFLATIVHPNANSLLSENVEIVRHKVTDLKNLEQSLSASTRPLCTVNFVDDAPIEGSRASLYHADFANRNIGGGALTGGAVQEEILFAIKPELFVSMMLCEGMTEGEVIVMHGARQFSHYTGYGFRAFTFDPKSTLQLAVQTSCQAESQCPSIVAFDAVDIGWYPVELGKARNIARDTLKALIAFSHTTDGTVATGHWGCGAFGGDTRLKFLQQWAAASAAGLRVVQYHTFHHTETPAIISLRDAVLAIGAQVETKNCGDGCSANDNDSSSGKELSAGRLYIAILMCQYDYEGVLAFLRGAK